MLHRATIEEDMCSKIPVHKIVYRERDASKIICEYARDEHIKLWLKIGKFEKNRRIFC